jgi:hypothetical protein
MSGTIASPLALKEHLAVFETIIKDRCNAIERENLLILLVDTCPEDALLPLAGEFDVLGYKGWLLTDSVADKRELIKNAIKIHRHKGTPYSIKEALKTLGLTDVVIEEGVAVPAILYNAHHNYNGAFFHGDYESWALFNVIISPPDDYAMTAEILYAIRFMINEYKAARCRLAFLSISLGFTEEIITVTDGLDTSEDDDFTEGIEIGIHYDGAHLHDGTHMHDDDIFEVIVTPV